MGLLSRWRGNSPSDPPDAEDAAPEVDEAPDVPDTEALPEPAPAPREVISAATLAAVPEWVKVPPPQPLLPPMPLVVEQRFDTSLATWKPPEMFIEDLGHAVSGAAPSGIVDAVATPIAEPVVYAEPVAEPPSSAADLTLASLPPVTTGNRAPTAQVRRLQWDDVEPQIRTVPTVEGVSPPAEWAALPTVSTPEPVLDLPLAPPASDLTPTQQQPSAAADESQSPVVEAPAPAEPTSELVGSSPLAAAPEPLVEPAASVRPFNRLIQAPTPPEMPLANLPSSLIPRPAEVTRTEVTRTLAGEGSPPEPSAVAPPVPEAPAAEPEAQMTPAAAPASPPPPAATAAPAPAPSASPPPPAAAPAEATAALVGDRPLTGAPVEETEAASVAVPVMDAPAGVVDSDLPLAGLAPPSAPAPAVTTQRLVPEPMPEPTPEPSPETGVPAVAASSSSEATATPPAPDSDPIAPLVGAAPPISAEATTLGPDPSSARPEQTAQVARAVPDTPLAPPASPSRARSGLGEPMTELPSTARTWDITSMSRDQQVRASRELMQRNLAAFRATAAQNTGAAIPSAPRPAPDMTLPPAQPVAPRGPQTVYAGSRLPSARVESVGPAPTGEVFDDLPPYGEQTAPLVSLAPPLDADVPEPAPAPAPSSSEGARVRTAVGQRAGMDLSSVPVDRSPTAAAEVRRLGARAMTSDRGIAIPPEVGTLDSGEGEAVFAHELTHVVQRARLGTTLPPEFTGEGRQLEAEALSTEMTFRASAPLPLLPVERTADRVPPAGFGGTAPETASGPDLPLAGPTGPTQGVDEDTIVASIMNRMASLTTGFAGGPVTEEITSSNVLTSLGSPMAMGAPMMAGAGAAAPSSPMGASIQRAQELPDANEHPAAAAAAQEAAEAAEEGPFAHRPTDDELEKLSYWLYPLIRYRLKGELREDRERAGLLTDNYRRW